VHGAPIPLANPLALVFLVDQSAPCPTLGCRVREDEGGGGRDDPQPPAPKFEHAFWISATLRPATATASASGHVTSPRPARAATTT